MNDYYALTIGPIFKTMAMARKTREIWATSYFFSHLMKLIIKRVKGENGLTLILPACGYVLQKNDAEIQSDNITDNKYVDFIEHQHVAGIFPDRMIIKVSIPDKTHFDTLKIVNSHIKLGFDDFFKTLAIDNHISQDDFKNFKENYFQLYSILKSIPDHSNPLKILYPILDSLEQRPGLLPIHENNFLVKQLERINNWSVYKQVFPGQKRFPQVLEIASRDMIGKTSTKGIITEEDFDKIFDECNNDEKSDEKSDQIEQIKNLKKFKHEIILSDGQKKEAELFMRRHKYFAIVQADGDNIGRVIQEMYNSKGTTLNSVEYEKENNRDQNEIKNKGDKAVNYFSSKLMLFGIEATELVRKFKGTSVYMGGDDLLFFAPVVCNNKTIFHLVNDLDELFKKLILDDHDINEVISNYNASITLQEPRPRLNMQMSYGISITYYKYPLKESLEKNRELLNLNAKLVPGKNAVAFQWLKHSGHIMGATWRKDWLAFKMGLLPLLNPEKENQALLASIQYKVEPLRALLNRIFTGRDVHLDLPGYNKLILELDLDASRKKYLDYFKLNFLNESIHKSQEINEFINFAFAYLLQLYRDFEDMYGNNAHSANSAVDAFYSSLRFLQFIQQADNETESVPVDNTQAPAPTKREEETK